MSMIKLMKVTSRRSLPKSS